MSSRAKQKDIHLNGYRDHRELYLRWLSGAKIELCKLNGSQYILQEFPSWEPGLVYREKLIPVEELDEEVKVEKKELAYRIGHRIRMKRNEIEMTRLSLQRRTGISSTNLAGIEQGVINATVYTLFRISKALRCEVADLIPKSEDV